MKARATLNRKLRFEISKGALETEISVEARSNLIVRPVANRARPVACVANRFRNQCFELRTTRMQSKFTRAQHRLRAPNRIQEHLRQQTASKRPQTAALRSTAAR